MSTLLEKSIEAAELHPGDSISVELSHPEVGMLPPRVGMLPPKQSILREAAPKAKEIGWCVLCSSCCIAVVRELQTRPRPFS